MISLGGEKSTKEIRECPSCHKKFLGDCPVTSCPLNITHKTTGTGGCFLLLKKPSLIEASYQLNLTTTTAERRYNVVLEDALKLEKLISKANLLKEDEKHCEICGKAGDNCSSYGCKRRVRFLEIVKYNSMLGNPFLHISDNKLWHIILSGKFNYAVDEKFTTAANQVYNTP